MEDIQERLIKLIKNMNEDRLFYIEHYAEVLKSNNIHKVETEQGIEIKYTEFVFEIKREVRDRYNNRQEEIKIEIEGEKLKSIEEIADYFDYKTIISEVKEGIQKHLKNDTKCYIKDIKKKDINIKKMTKGKMKRNKYVIIVDYIIVLEDLFSHQNPRIDFILDTMFQLEIYIEDNIVTIGELIYA